MYKNLFLSIFFMVFTTTVYSYEYANIATNKSDTKIHRDTKVLLITNMGEMLLELYPEKAPLTVKNFLTYVEKKYYDGLIFHRVIPRFMIQDRKSVV